MFDESQAGARPGVTDTRWAENALVGTVGRALVLAGLALMIGVSAAVLYERYGATSSSAAAASSAGRPASSR